MKKVFFMASALVMTTAVAQQKKDSTRVIDEVLINAIRAKETLPVTFSNLSKNEIKKKNFGQQMPMLLTSLPNVVSYSEDGTGFGATALFIRGNDLQRTNVTINGIPYNDSESLGVYWYNLSLALLRVSKFSEGWVLLLMEQVHLERASMCLLMQFLRNLMAKLLTFMEVITLISIH